MINVSSSKPKSSINNVIWNIFWTAWATIVNFVMVPILISHIGDSYYGIYVLLTSINSVMGLLNLGLGEATLRYVAYYYAKGDIDSINRVVGSTFFVYLFSSFAGFMILFFGAPQIVKLLSLESTDVSLVIKLVKITGIGFIFNLINSVLDAIPKAMQRYDVNTKVLLFQSIILTIGNFVILLNDGGILSLVIWSTFSIIITIIVNLIIVKRLIPGLNLFPAFSTEGIKEVFGYGFFSMLSSILNLIWGQADRLLLGLMVNPSSVAYLSVPQSVAMRGSAAIGNAGSVLFPKFAAIKEKHKKKQLYLNSTWLLLIATVVIFVPFTILFPNFLTLWVGSEFSRKSAYIGQLIALSCIVRGAFVPYTSLFKGIGKPNYLSILYTITGITSLTVNLILIPKIGLKGVGYSYLATIIWGLLTIIFTWTKIFQESSIKPLFRVVLLPIIQGLILLPIFYLFKNWLGIMGWLKLFITMLFFMFIVSVTLVGTDYLIGRKNWYFEPVYIFIIEKIRKFYPATIKDEVRK